MVNPYGNWNILWGNVKWQENSLYTKKQNNDNNNLKVPYDLGQTTTLKSKVQTFPKIVLLKEQTNIVFDNDNKVMI